VLLRLSGHRTLEWDGSDSAAWIWARSGVEGCQP